MFELLRIVSFFYKTFRGKIIEKIVISYEGGGSRVAGWRDWAHFGRDYCGIAGLAEKISGISGLRKNRDRDLAKK